ncbi:MAG: hypothetical protein HYS09_07025 [Chloroflexi bacterium]|nr:hypothetical protein [Chloroflexota bacterium]
MAREALLRKVQPYSLHGEPYYQLFFSYADEPEAVREARMAATNVYPNPQEGDTVLIDSVLNVVTGVEKKG